MEWLYDYTTDAWYEDAKASYEESRESEEY